MLGRSLPQGSQAISFHNTLFRVSELCWIKAVRLSIPELVVRVLAAALGIAWIVAMKNTKGSYYNIEFLLAAFPLVLAWITAGSLKIGCTGDFEESYEARRGMQSSLFRGWIETLRKNEPGWLHLKSGNHDLLLNPNRVAWIRPCIQWQVFPVIVAAVFFGFLKVLGMGFNLEPYPVVGEFDVLVFEGGAKTIKMLAWAIIGTSLAAFGLSVKRSVEICGTGGVQDVFPMSAEDQTKVFGIMAGTVGANAPVAKSKPKPKPKRVAEEPTVETAAVPEAKEEAAEATETPEEVTS